MITTPHIELRIAREIQPLTCSHVLRFTECPGESPIPILYQYGHRVSQEWSIDLKFHSPADPNPNANTT